jgi:hypothetical protein
MGQSVCRALTADFTATRNIQGAVLGDKGGIDVGLSEEFIAVL